MLTSRFFTVVMLAMLWPHARSGRSPPTVSQDLGNCPKGATEGQPCRQNRGFCVQPEVGPGNPPSQGNNEKRLRCMPGRLETKGAKKFLFGLTAVGIYTCRAAAIRVASQSSGFITVNVKAPRVGYNVSKQIRSGDTLDIPASLQMETSSDTSDRGIGIETSEPASVYLEYTQCKAIGGTLIIPWEKLSTKYIIPSWKDPQSELCGYAQLLVIGTQNGTVVSLYFRDGTSRSKAIDSYQIFSVLSKDDLTGTFVNASKKVAVFTGNINVKVAYNYPDSLVEQVPPISSFDIKYIAFQPWPGREYILRVIAVEDGTNIQLSDGTSGQLNRADFADYKLSTAVVVTSNQEVMVVEYGLGAQSGSDASSKHGPSMLILAGVQRFWPSYIFYVPYFEIAALMITIESDSDVIDSLLLNNAPFVADDTSSEILGPETYIVLYKNLTHGYQELSANARFGAYLMFSRPGGESWLALDYNI